MIKTDGLTDDLVVKPRHISHQIRNTLKLHESLFACLWNDLVLVEKRLAF